MDKRALGVFVLCLVIAFFAGRYSGPDKVTESSHESVKQTDKETSKETSKEAENKNEKIDQDTVTTRTDIVFPDGRRVTHSKTERKKSSVVASVIDTTKAEDKTDNKTTQETIDKQKVTEYSSGVMVGPLVGYSINNFSTPVIGGFAAKKIIGPIAFGLWGFATPTVTGGLFLGAYL